MATMHNRSHLPRQDFPDTIPVQHAEQWSACCGSCQQGRRLCPCPDACQMPDDSLAPMRGIANGLAIVVALYVLCALAWWLA